MKELIEWTGQNKIRLCFNAIIAAICLYAAAAWNKNTIAQEMKTYLPIAAWDRWEQDRSEWQVNTEARVVALEKGLGAQRAEIILRLEQINTEVRVVQTLLQEHKVQTERVVKP
jgi:hypothetical protein